MEVDLNHMCTKGHITSVYSRSGIGGEVSNARNRTIRESNPVKTRKGQ